MRPLAFSFVKGVLVAEGGVDFRGDGPRHVVAAAGPDLLPGAARDAAARPAAPRAPHVLVLAVCATWRTLLFTMKRILQLSFSGWVPAVDRSFLVE